MTNAPKAPVVESPPMTRFLPARAKLWIGSLDEPTLEVRAQYNPKELQIDKAVPWQAHKANDNRPAGKRVDKNPSKQSDLEFTGAPTRSMSVELLFDGYEGGDSVEPDVRRLEELSSVRDPESKEPQLRRPHHCVVAWGESHTGMRPFRCVIESLAVKYTMWDCNGTPLRATCTLKLKEATRMEREVEPTVFLSKQYVPVLERRSVEMTARERAESEANERWNETGRAQAQRQEAERQAELSRREEEAKAQREAKAKAKAKAKREAEEEQARLAGDAGPGAPGAPGHPGGDPGGDPGGGTIS